ncbi:MAG: Membrane-bound lytic murein transglycosylase B precursor [Syntrophus sp. PtaU1.Bin208]|nr:MAG: Membrane-bound lytic murein transglycosylase B precursor [Syntrophus sp. PtaU1.Bin208]
MTTKSPRLKYLITAVITAFLFLDLFDQSFAEVTNSTFFNQLQERLIADGFDAKRIRKLYQREGIFFETRGIAAYFQHNEARLNYNEILARRTLINDARNYMNEHAETLSAAERKFGVAPEVITAIILVETNLGRCLGKRSIINILSSMAALSEPAPREYLYEQLNEKKRFGLSKYNVRADRKSRWAYKELKAFLTYADRHEVDPLSVTGSYAGALGIAQFMPSNILIYGQDGNGDGRIDLFHDADAIFSIASYLKHFGWKPNIGHDQAFKVIYHYNHSRYYVNTILKINELLAG